MADHLSSADWKKLIKEHSDAKAPAIGGQLDAYAKALSKKDLVEQLSALNEIQDEAKAAEGKNSKIKEVAAYLSSMAKEAAKTAAKVEAQLAKQAEEDAEKDGEDEDESKALDTELLGMLKKAKSATADNPMRFAVVLKSASEGALIIAKKKVSPDQIKEAKAKSGGGRVVAAGVVYTDSGQLIFETQKDPAATLGKAIKMFAFRDTGKKIKPVCRANVKLEGEDIEDEGGEAEGNGKHGFSPVAFAKWRLTWEASKKKVLADMQQLSKSIAENVDGEKDLGPELRDDVAQTLDELFGEVEDAVDDILNGETEEARAKAKSAAIKEMDRLRKEFAADAVVKVVEKNKIMPLSIQEPVDKAIAQLQASLSA